MHKKFVILSRALEGPIKKFTYANSNDLDGERSWLAQW